VAFRFTTRSLSVPAPQAGERQLRRLLQSTVVAAAAGVLLCVTSSGGAQETVQATANIPINRTYRVRPLGDLLPPEDGSAANQHPLVPALKLAEDRLAYIERFVKDYTCDLAIRERVDGKLTPYQYMRVKCRNARENGAATPTPFAVYMKYLGPSSVKDREVLYVEGENGGDMLVRKGGRRRAYLQVWLNPNGDQARAESRYPITEFGVENLVRRLIEVAQEDMQYGECHVRIVDNASLDNRSCTAIQVTHPTRRDHFRFHIAKILIDNQSQLPVHYSAYDWPTEEGGKPELLEEYTYRNMKVNVGLSDADFQRENPEYGFRKTTTAE
jgi:hypothetical protein